MIKPVQDKVAVKVEVTAKKTEGGIELITDIAADAPAQGEVIAVGPGKYNDNGVREELEVQVGDIIAFPKNAGVVIESEGVTVMHEAEIIAVVG